MRPCQGPYQVNGRVGIEDATAASDLPPYFKQIQRSAFCGVALHSTIAYLIEGLRRTFIR